MTDLVGYIVGKPRRFEDGTGAILFQEIGTVTAKWIHVPNNEALEICMGFEVGAQVTLYGVKPTHVIPGQPMINQLLGNKPWGPENYYHFDFQVTNPNAGDPWQAWAYWLLPRITS